VVLRVRLRHAAPSNRCRRSPHQVELPRPLRDDQGVRGVRGDGCALQHVPLSPVGACTRSRPVYEALRAGGPELSRVTRASQAPGVAGTTSILSKHARSRARSATGGCGAGRSSGAIPPHESRTVAPHEGVRHRFRWAGGTPFARPLASTADVVVTPGNTGTELRGSDHQPRPPPAAEIEADLL